MKTKHLKLALSLSLLTGTLPVFTNFQSTDWKKNTTFTLDSVHEASRIGHAKELLGNQEYYQFATQIESSKDLNRRLYNQVLRSLPVAYKAKARQITQTIIKQSAQYQMDPVFVMAIIRTESLFNPKALGRHGEIGLMQLKPDTALWIANKFQIPYENADTLLNPHSNIKLGMAYLNLLRDKFDKKAVSYVSAYNMGPLNVRKLLAQNIKPQEYKSKVMENYSKIYSRLAEKRSEILVAAH